MVYRKVRKSTLQLNHIVRPLLQSNSCLPPGRMLLLLERPENMLYLFLATAPLQDRLLLTTRGRAPHSCHVLKIPSVHRFRCWELRSRETKSSKATIRSPSDQRDCSADSIRGSAIGDVVKAVGEMMQCSSCLSLTGVRVSRTARPVWCVTTGSL